jgi:uncharacterized membrane protein (DUF2068 family)
MNQGRPVGLRLIIGYKYLKAVLQLAAAGVLWYGARHGLADYLTGFADNLREHAVPAASHRFISALDRFNHQPHGLRWLAAALVGDAVVSAFEAWALAAGYVWAPWIVVGATASLLPFEVVALFRHLRVGRVLVLVINVLIVVYLIGRVRRDQAKSRPWRGSALSGRA